MSEDSLPIIDMAPLFRSDAVDEQREVAEAIRAACRRHGFFFLAGHGVAPALLAELEAVSRRFFALPQDAKMAIPMAEGGPAWRGYFPVGQELTSGKPDIKEGLYFGSELPPDHPRVQAGWPLHGANLWPAELPEMRETVLGYMAAVSRAAQVLLRGMAMALGLPADYFQATYTAEPTILFRIFHYPATAPEGIDASQSWSVGEHTDYGLLTLLAQDKSGGLQVKSQGRWIAVPPLPGTLVCNIGDMLDLLTGGWFCSTPHRVDNRSGRDRLSFPLFFDPDFAAEMRRLPAGNLADEAGYQAGGGDRWDGADLQAFEGTYGDYLMGKVSKVFPELGRKVL